MIDLYDDQQELFDEIRRNMSVYKFILAQAATGFGKTVLGAAMINGSRAKGTTSIFMVPRRQLLKQSAESFKAFGIPFSYIAAGNPYNPHSKTYLATIGTLLNRVRKGTAPEIKVLFVDETHFGGAALDEIIAYYKAKGAWIIGLSATPERLDGKGLDRYYQAMVEGPAISWLIENKRLSDYRLFAPSQPDLTGIGTVAGDYAKGQLAKRMKESTKLIGDAVHHYKAHAMGKLGITFCTSIEHSEMVAQAYRDGGISAAHVDGETPDDEMLRIVRAYARREILQLCCADLLTFGFDLSSASGMDVTVESMSDLAPTKSLAKQMQKWGRVLRKKPYPAMIFDHAGNAIHANGRTNHGLPDDDRRWTLQGRVKGAGSSSSRSMPVKNCSECFCVHRPAPVCPQCGHVHAVDSRMVKQVDGTLLEVSRTKPREMTGEERERMREAVDDMTKNAIAKGIPPMRARQWATKKYLEGLDA